MIIGSDYRLKVGDRLNRSIHLSNGEFVVQPTVILREATLEEWKQQVIDHQAKMMSGSPVDLDAEDLKDSFFYEISTD